MPKLNIYIDILESPPYLWGRIAFPVGTLRFRYITPNFDSEPDVDFAEYLARVVRNGEPDKWGDLETQTYQVVILRKHSCNEPDGIFINNVEHIPFEFRRFMEQQVFLLFEKHYPKAGKNRFYYYVKPRIRFVNFGQSPDDEAELDEDELEEEI